jgi:hypothetical protein
MSDKDSIVAHIISEYVAGDFTIPVLEHYIIIWLDFVDGGLLDMSGFTYAYLWQKVNVSIKRFSECTDCYSHILSLRDREEKLFVVITDPKTPLVQKDLYLLWSRLLFEPQVAKIYIIQTKFDFTFYRYWFQFKQHQKMYFIPNEILLLEQLTNNRNKNTIVICLDTGKSEILDINKYKFNELFSDATECFNYIISIRHQQMILVINSQNSNVFTYRIVLSKLFSTKYYIYMLSTLSSIYILTGTRTKQISIKETDLFTNFDLFQKQLEQDISPNSPYLSNDEVIYSSSAEIFQMSLRSVSTEQFLYYTNIIAKMPQSLEAKTEMIEECREHYKKEPSELKKINKFVYEYYEQKCHTAIWWYTQDSFLYRRLNEACRTEDIDLIFTFRNFISDLLQQLQEEHSKFYDVMYGVPITVYRGQKISIKELKHLEKNRGQLYSTNTFLSATGDFDVALVFAIEDDQCSELESVIFKYKIDTSIETKRPYADIRLLSSKPKEEEIMFCMGTIFKIEYVTQEEIYKEDKKHTYWCIEMELVNENNDDDIHLTSRLSAFEQRIQNQPTLLILGDLAKRRSRVSNDFCKAERYYRLYHAEVLPVDDKIDYISLIRAYESLASICIAKGDYAAGIEYYETIIKTCLTIPLSLFNKGEDQRIAKIISVYKSIALTYQHRTGDYDSVIKTYQNLYEFIQNQEHRCLICINNTINQIGDAFRKQARWSEAIDSYQKAYALISDDNNYDQRQLDDAQEKLSKIQSRNHEVLFLLLFIIWYCSYSLNILYIDDIILWIFMPLSLFRLINYYSIRYAIEKVFRKNLWYLRRFDDLMQKIQKKFKNNQLQKQKERFLSHLYTIIPPFTYFLTQQSHLLTGKNILNKRTYFVIVATVFLSAYSLITSFLLITRTVMILFVISWLSFLNTVQYSILIIFYYCCCQRQLLWLLFAYIVLLEADFQCVARQNRSIPDVFIYPCSKHSSH